MSSASDDWKDLKEWLVQSLERISVPSSAIEGPTLVWRTLIDCQANKWNSDRNMCTRRQRHGQHIVLWPTIISYSAPVISSWAIFNEDGMLLHSDKAEWRHLVTYEHFSKAVLGDAEKGLRQRESPSICQWQLLRNARKQVIAFSPKVYDVQWRMVDGGWQSRNEISQGDNFIFLDTFSTLISTWWYISRSMETMR